VDDTTVSGRNSSAGSDFGVTLSAFTTCSTGVPENGSGTQGTSGWSILKAAEAMEDVQLILVLSLWKGGSHKEECVK